MRRLGLLITTVAALAVAALVLTTGRAEGGSGTYKVDVIFDNSRGLLTGQLVEIAGARVGSIDEVSVTKDFKARISMSIDGRFAPFREDATCTIRPQGLI